MMMRTLLASLFLLVLVMNVSMAADDPMKSLFLFQQQMAEGGNSAAMMKLGEMYEKGEGTPRDLAKAREMYQQAKAKGHPGADVALKQISNQQPRAAQQAQKDRAVQERARKEADANQQAAERERVRQAKLERQMAAQQKAAREKAAKEMARRDALAKQQREEAARRAAQQRAAQQKAVQQKKLVQQKAVQEAAARKQAEEIAKQEAEKKGFKSDPCEGPAARVMSTCKK